jgi:hypothetical protein
MLNTSPRNHLIDRNDRIWQALVGAAVIAMIVVNALANILPINGVKTAIVSDGYPSYFVPAGYVFSIWGLIYLGLLVFAASHALVRAAGALIAPVRLLFVLSCLENGVWLICWHYYQLALSVAVMLTLLLTLIVIYQRLWTAAGSRPSVLVQLTVLSPISLYLAWICVATIANVSMLLPTLGWDGWPLSGPTWAAAMMGVAAVILGWLSLRFSDGIPPLVLGWALFGIVSKFQNQATMRVVGSALAVAMLAVAIIAFLRRRPSADAV